MRGDTSCKIEIVTFVCGSALSGDNLSKCFPGQCLLIKGERKGKTVLVHKNLEITDIQIFDNGDLPLIYKSVKKFDREISAADINEFSNTSPGDGDATCYNGTWAQRVCFRADLYDN